MKSNEILLMEQSNAEILYYDCRKLSAEEAGRQFQGAIWGREDIAAILLFTAGVEREIDQFLTCLMNEDGGYEIPILGAQSGAAHPYICGSFRQTDAFIIEEPSVSYRYEVSAYRCTYSFARDCLKVFYL